MPKDLNPTKTNGSSFRGILPTPYQRAIRKQQDVDADLERLCTLIHNGSGGYNWHHLDLNQDLLPEKVRILTPTDQITWLRRVLSRMTHFCFKCNVVTNPQKHICVDCLLVTRLGWGSRKCDCTEECTFAVLPAAPHAEFGPDSLSGLLA